MSPPDQARLHSDHRQPRLPACDSIDEVTERLRAFRLARGWERYHTPKDLALSVAVEAGELLEHFQWRSPEEIDARMASDGDAIASELADIAIHVMQLADVAGLSLASALEAKLELNEERYPVDLAYGSNLKYSELDDGPRVRGGVDPVVHLKRGA